ncbi:hypothetical protein ACE6H2_010763 [Prunus campanulata]
MPKGSAAGIVPKGSAAGILGKGSAVGILGKGSAAGFLGKGSTAGFLGKGVVAEYFCFGILELLRLMPSFLQLEVQLEMPKGCAVALAMPPEEMAHARVQGYKAWPRPQPSLLSLRHHKQSDLRHGGTLHVLQGSPKQRC